MGSIALPADGVVYLDSSALIYSVERHEPYFGLLAPVWQQAARGELVLVSSELALAEVLVRPIREQNEVLIRRYHDLFGTSDVHMVPASRQLWEDADGIGDSSICSSSISTGTTRSSQTGCDDDGLIGRISWSLPQSQR